MLYHQRSAAPASSQSSEWKAEDEVPPYDVSIASSSRDENSFEVPAADDMSSSQDFSNDSFDVNPKRMKLATPTPSEDTKKDKPLFDEEKLLQNAFDILQKCAAEVDESYHFGNLVACKLRTFDEYTRCAIQTDIMNLFLRANAGYYNKTEESTHRTCPSSTAKSSDSPRDETPITTVSPFRGQRLFVGTPALTEDPPVLKEGPVTLTEDPRTLTLGPATLTAVPATLKEFPSILTTGPTALTVGPPILKEVPDTVTGGLATLPGGPLTLKEVPPILIEDPVTLTGGPASVTDNLFTKS